MADMFDSGRVVIRGKNGRARRVRVQHAR
jgi:hypothetical protein